MVPIAEVSSEVLPVRLPSEAETVDDGVSTDYDDDYPERHEGLQPLPRHRERCQSRPHPSKRTHLRRYKTVRVPLPFPERCVKCPFPGEWTHVRGHQKVHP